MYFHFCDGVLRLRFQRCKQIENLPKLACLHLVKSLALAKSLLRMLSTRLRRSRHKQSQVRGRQVRCHRKYLRYTLHPFVATHRQSFAYLGSCRFCRRKFAYKEIFQAEDRLQNKVDCRQSSEKIDYFSSYAKIIPPLLAFAHCNTYRF